MSAVRFTNVTKIYPGTSRPIVDHFSLTVEQGELLVLTGPSGCGKSTVLRLLAGLEEPDSGRIFLGEQDITSLPPRERDMAMVFQSYALYPHMTVAENMAFALKIAGVEQEERLRRVQEAARLLDLEEQLGSSPNELSGGQRQRVAMGRALVRKPRVFLMDEPMSNLDAALRSATREQVNQLVRKLGTTTIYVTHDQAESMLIGDRIAVINQGRIQQVGRPREVHDHPANIFVATFIGAPTMNLLAARVDSDGRVLIGECPIVGPEVTEALNLPERIIVGVRPEDMLFDPQGLPVRVRRAEDTGSNIWAHGYVENTGENVIALNPALTRSGSISLPWLAGGGAEQQLIHLLPRPERVHFFSIETGNRLNY